LFSTIETKIVFLCSGFSKIKIYRIENGMGLVRHKLDWHWYMGMSFGRLEYILNAVSIYRAFGKRI
jgi:hypothetical protein